jgi:hypothetical protein
MNGWMRWQIEQWATNPPMTCVNECADEFAGECADERTDECADERIDECADKQLMQTSALESMPIGTPAGATMSESTSTSTRSTSTRTQVVDEQVDERRAGLSQPRQRIRCNTFRAPYKPGEAGSEAMAARHSSGCRCDQVPAERDTHISGSSCRRRACGLGYGQPVVRPSAAEFFDFGCHLGAG